MFKYLPSKVYNALIDAIDNGAPLDRSIADEVASGMKKLAIEIGVTPVSYTHLKQVLAVNGEIYNHREIRTRYAGKYDFQTGSDCEVILATVSYTHLIYLTETHKKVANTSKS